MTPSQARQIGELTPMMRQFFKIKEKHKDHILFYRLGDFYEMFFDDAITASKELGLTLTGRDCGLSERAPMCGVPHHSSETYVARLIRAGFKVAICEQMEDPALAKGVVSREVVRVITPGTVVENSLLDEDRNNYLCSIFLDERGCGLAFADISTGELSLVELDTEEESVITGHLARFSPREVIFNSAFLSKKRTAQFLRDKLRCTADLIDDKKYLEKAASEAVTGHFGRSLSELGLTQKPRCLRSIGGLLAYLSQTQKTSSKRIISINLLEEAKLMRLDASARSNLELLQTERSGDKKGSLLWVIDKTRTPMGRRLIKSVISQPIVSPIEIEKRLDAVEELYKNERMCRDIIYDLGGIFDLERLITRVIYGSATPKELNTLRDTMEKIPALINLLSGVKVKNLTDIISDMDPLYDLVKLIRGAINDDPPSSLKDGGVIRLGFNRELDELNDIMNNSKSFLSKLENDQRLATGIKNLKIGYNKVFGYYFEVTKSNLASVPDSYIRKQTLAGCERYVIQELKELEEKILAAQEKAQHLEQSIYDEVRAEITRNLHRIQKTATAISWLDLYCSFARVSLDNRYVRPQIDSSDSIYIEDGRHPVVEQMLDMSPFVPNSASLDTAKNQIAVITGPNMAGKSTYMRQTALIVLMAQIGCFVSAKSAAIGVVDGIYTRIGAADDLSAGQSTFMLEMVELAHILLQASSKSLLILDEIGRGTSTYDGMSIARAALEYIADKGKLGAKTMFATHYHELTVLESELGGVKNYHLSCKKRGDDVIFLRKIVRGGADDSFGIEVSKLAGIPVWIVERAKEILEELESGKLGEKAEKCSAGGDFQITFDDRPASEIEEALRSMDPSTYTPLEALTFLYNLKKMAENLE